MVTRAVLVGSADERLATIVEEHAMRMARASFDDLATLARAGATQPDVVVVDVRGQGVLPSALEQLKREHRSTPVIIVASSLDPGLMLAAMRVGVNECIIEPITEEDVHAALSRVATIFERSKVAGEIFAFVGVKGGVGATTTAVNVATALAKSSPAKTSSLSNTLFVDCHFSFGDAAEFFGAEARFSIVDALENTHRFDESVFGSLVVETKAGVDLLASSGRPMLVDVDAERIRALLDFTANHYRYTVLDVPRSSPRMLDALEAATKIILVGNQELASVKNANVLANLLRQRYGNSRVMVTLARYDRNAEIGQDDVESTIGLSIAHVIPNDYGLAAAALNRGRPLFLNNHSKLASTYEQMADDLIGKKIEAPKPARSGGIFGRLTR